MIIDQNTLISVLSQSEYSRTNEIVVGYSRRKQVGQKSHVSGLLKILHNLEQQIIEALIICPEVTTLGYTTLHSIESTIGNYFSMVLTLSFEIVPTELLLLIKSFERKRNTTCLSLNTSKQ